MTEKAAPKSIKKTKFVNNEGQEVRGVKVSLRNYINIVNLFTHEHGETAETVSRTGDISKQRVRVKTKKGWRVANIGDVVALGSDGYFFVIPGEGQDSLEDGFWKVKK